MSSCHLLLCRCVLNNAFFPGGTVKFSLSQKLILPPQLPPLLIRPGESCVSWRRRRGKSMPYRLFGPAGRAPRYFRKPVDLIVWLAASLDTLPLRAPVTSHSHPPRHQETQHYPSLRSSHSQHFICSVRLVPIQPPHRCTFSITASAWWFCPSSNCNHGPYTSEQVDLLGVLTCSVRDACCTPFLHDLSVLSVHRRTISAAPFGAIDVTYSLPGI